MGVGGGLQRRPAAHTCSCMLQISKFYESFMDFRTEFDNYLGDGLRLDICMEFDNVNNAILWVIDFV